MDAYEMMRAPSFAARFCRDLRGSTAVEFALVLPAFIMLVLGVIEGAQLANAISSMNYAVQEASRCAALNKTTCGTTTTTVAFARTKYLGPGAPAFVASNSGCGATVTATTTFKLDVAIMSYNVPLSATACFPMPPP
jgi:Flp pilus assembly protein TadG